MTDWSRLQIAPDGTHHLEQGAPAYAQRFDSVLKFHAPGLAPVSLGGQAWHIHPTGEPAYPSRFLDTFGFYDGLAAVRDSAGWFHIGTDGRAIYVHRYGWCGNFQEGRCTIRTADGRYAHIDPDGRQLDARTWAYAGDYRDGSAVVQRDDGLSSHIDLTGEPVHGNWFLDLDVFHKGYARARDEFGWTHINSRGVAAYDRRFASVEPFYNGQARVERFDGGLEIIEVRGHKLVELRPTDHAEPVGGKVLARTAWGRVSLVQPAGKPPYILKWTRGSNDREVEALLTLRGLRGVPAILGRRRCDMNDQLKLSFCEGQVVGQPRQLRVYPEQVALRVTKEILAVCMGMHSAGWIHTDIHPGNVLTGEPATLLDFACAVRASSSHPWRGEINWGVWEYVPPEQLTDYGSLDPATDIYSTAALCLAMLTGAPPFRIDVVRYFDKGGWPAVRTAFLQARTEQTSWNVRKEILGALMPALSIEPSERPTSRELYEVLAHV